VKILGKMRLHAGTVSAVTQESMTKSPEGEPAEGDGDARAERKRNGAARVSAPTKTAAKTPKTHAGAEIRA